MIRETPDARRAALRERLERYRLLILDFGLGVGFMPGSALELAALLRDAADALSAPSPAVTVTVSELRAGEENDGLLESTDLFVEGRGISLLINIPAWSSATYSLGVDEQERQGGSIGSEAEQEIERLKARRFVCDGCGEPVRVDGGLVTYHALAARVRELEASGDIPAAPPAKEWRVTQRAARSLDEVLTSSTSGDGTFVQPAPPAGEEQA